MAVDNARQCQLIYEDIITSGNFNFMTSLSEMSSQALLSPEIVHISCVYCGEGSRAGGEGCGTWTATWLDIKLKPGAA